jgi:lysophospholipase L1-like esterase
MATVKSYFISILLLIPVLSKAQDFPVKIQDYSFVHKEHNKIEFYGDSSAFDVFFEKMDSVLSFGIGNLNIVHFGGSHIQADIWSGRIREHIQGLARVEYPSRGLVFPYKAARTNNPGTYNVSYSGKWEGCRNSVLRHHCDFGMTGITATTYDTLSSIGIDFKNKYHPHYYFNSVKIFHDMGPEIFSMLPDSNGHIVSIEVDSIEGYTNIVFDSLFTELDLTFKKTDSLQKKFVMYGMYFENGYPDIVYNSIGVNGASVPSYLRCEMLGEQLKHIKPDLVIFSIGINDAYEYDFTQWSYEQNYNQLIEIIKKASPNTAILFTTNNDSYRRRGRRRYLNKNGALVQKSMKKMSSKYGAGLWDMFEVMGGLSSANVWLRNGMMKRDKIHFTASGYRLMGDLMFNAMMYKYGEYLASKRKF